MEKFNRDIEALRVELSKARERAERAEDESSRLRVEIGRIKSEKTSKEIVSEIREIQGSNSSGGKLELMEEVGAKQAEIERLEAELNSIKRSLDDCQHKNKGLEGEVAQLQVALAAARKAALTSATHEVSSERQVVPTSNSRGSFLGGTGSSNAATQFMLLQKDNEIRELNEQWSEAKREISETQSLAQRLTKMLEETQNSAKEREKRLQQRLEVKDSEINLLQRDMLEKAEGLEYAQREAGILETKVSELEQSLLKQKEEFNRSLLLEK